MCVILVLLFFAGLPAQSRDVFVLYESDFEITPADWTLAGEFSFAAPSGVNVCQTAHSGLAILGTNTSGDYADQQSLMDNYAQSPVVNITGASDLRVTYWSFTQFQGRGSDSADRDGGHLYMKVDGGAWRLVDRVVDHQEQKWTKHYLDISDLADGHTHVQFRFTYYSDDLTELTGWNVDDFTILEAAPFSGIKTVNSAGFPGGDVYNSLAAAIDDINTHGIAASGLTVNVSAGSVFNEEIPPLVVSGYDADHPLLFQKSGGGPNPLIVSNGDVSIEDDGAFTLWGASHIRISEIDISSSSNFLEYGYHISSDDFLEGSHHVEISGCTITIQNTLRSGTGIYQEVMAHPEDEDGTNSYNSYHNNTISASDGISLTNSQVLINPLFYDVDCMVYENTIQGYPNGLPGEIPTLFLGISAVGFDGVRIYQNEVSELYASQGGIGIQCFWGIGGMIYQNRVHNLVLNCSEAGFAITGVRAENCRIYNNMIYALDSNRNDSGNHFSVRGIAPDGYCEVDCNTVMIGTEEFVDYQSVACYMGDSSTMGYNRIRNNIFVNINECVLGGVTHYCIVARENFYHTLMGGYSNHNIYYTGEGASYVGLYGEDEAVILGGWRFYTDNDNNSYDINPQLISSSDLHINAAIATPVEGHAWLHDIPWITNDIDGNPRDTGKPDIGADEGDFLALYYPPLQASLFQPNDMINGIPINRNPLLTWTVNYGETVFSDPTYSYTYLSPNQSLVNSLDPAANVQGDGNTLYNSYISPGYLDPVTTYYWRVVIGNPAGEEVSDVFSFTTGSDAVVTEFPFTEDFEDAMVPPQSWVGGYNWPWDGGLNGNNIFTISMGGWIPDSTPGNVFNGSYAATSPPFGQPSYDWLITPSLQFPSTSNPELGFWLSFQRDAGSSTSFYVLAYTDGIWNLLASFDTPEQSTDYNAEIVLDLSDYAGETIKLAFVAGPESTFYPISIDDVSIRVNYSGYYSYAGTIPIGETGIELSAFTLEDYEIDLLEFDTGVTSTEIRDFSMDFTAGEPSHPVPDVSMVGFSCSGTLDDFPIPDGMIHFIYSGPRLTHAYQWSYSLSDWVELDLIIDSYNNLTDTGELVFYLDLSPGFKSRNSDFEFTTATGDLFDLGVVQDLQAEFTLSGNLRLHWSGAALITGYRLYQSDNPMSGWQLLAELNPNTTQWFLNPPQDGKRFYRISKVWEP